MIQRRAKSIREEENDKLAFCSRDQRREAKKFSQRGWGKSDREGLIKIDFSHFMMYCGRLFACTDGATLVISNSIRVLCVETRKRHNKPNRAHGNCARDLEAGREWEWKTNKFDFPNDLKCFCLGAPPKSKRKSGKC